MGHPDLQQNLGGGSGDCAATDQKNGAAARGGIADKTGSGGAQIAVLGDLTPE
jgi:hypothetical protein